MQTVENLYEEKNIEADCKATEESIDSYNQPNEPFFKRRICEFHVCLGCRQTQWRGQCLTCDSIEIIHI